MTVVFFATPCRRIGPSPQGISRIIPKTKEALDRTSNAGSFGI